MKKGRVEECNRGQGKEPVMFRAVQKKKKSFGKELFVMGFASHKLLDIYLCNMLMTVY